MLSFLLKVEFYNEDCRKEITAYHLLRAETFVEAVGMVEKFYKTDLVSVKVTAIEDDCGLITKECYEKIMKGDDLYD